MKRLKNLFIFISIIMIIGLVFTSWLLDRNLFNSVLEILIYMIGYGETSTNAIVSFILALVGILLVGAFSSLITVLFIEQKSKIKIDNKLCLNLSERPNAYINVKTKHWELYDIEVRVIYSLNGATYDESIGRYPYWKINKEHRLNISLDRGSVLYWYLQAHYEKNIPEDLIIKIDFVNGKNNQSYSAIQKYSMETNFIVNGESRIPSEKELENICGTDFDLSTLTIINKSYIKFNPIIESQYNKDFSNAIAAHIDLTNTNINDFGMLLFTFPFGGNWEFFKNQRYQLTFKVYCTANIDLCLEVKSSQNPKLIKKEIKANNNLETIVVNLNDLKSDELQCITEMCFTVFNSKDKDICGNFYIYDCCMQKL